jgi:FkbM family methyltransferase
MSSSIDAFGIDDRISTLLKDPRLYGAIRWRKFLAQCFVPKVFYDIGANDPFSADGQQTLYKPLMPRTAFFLFEAMAKHEPALIRSNEPYAIAVLDARDGVEKTFYETTAFARGTGDSLFLERTAAYAPATLVSSRHRTRRLDSLVDERGWPMPDFIKLDTQGSELDILRGAPRCLMHARGLQIECNVQKYNEGAPLLPEVLAFAQTAGFRVYDIAQFHFDPNDELLQVDVLFVRSELFKNG